MGTLSKNPAPLEKQMETQSNYKIEIITASNLDELEGSIEDFLLHNVKGKGKLVRLNYSDAPMGTYLFDDLGRDALIVYRLYDKVTTTEKPKE